jgi:hypothetical protein
MCITLEGALENYEFMSTVKNGRKTKATLTDIQEAVDEARGKGYSVLPPCDNVDEQGRCKGHDTELLKLNERFEKLENKIKNFERGLDKAETQRCLYFERAGKKGYYLDADTKKWERSN